MLHTFIGIHGKPSNIVAGSVPGSVCLELHGADDKYSDITFFTGDPALVDRLVRAFKPETTPVSAVEGLDDDVRWGEVNTDV